jgi:hypothetical protein
MAALKVDWESGSVHTKRSVVTGEDEASASDTYRWTDKPIVVFVADTDEDIPTSIVNEKIALASQAFYMVRMTTEEAEADSSVSEHGSGVRVLVINPSTEKVKIVKESQIKTKKVYGAMKSVANKFYNQKIDKIVKSHQKILLKQDNLYNQEVQLAKKLENEDNKSKREKIESERKEIAAELKDLASETNKMWALTART